MAAWEQRKLGELVSIASGMAPSLFNQGDQPYIKVDDLNHTQRVLTSTQSTVARSSCMAKIPAGSTIFAKRGAAIMTNKTRVTGVSAYMDTNMMALIPEGINGEFLYELIGTIGLSRIADTSTIPQINNKHIEPFIVTIPHSREEQQIVATFFTSLDNLITLHQRKQGNVWHRNGAWNGLTNSLVFRTPLAASSPSCTPTVARMDEADALDKAAAGSVPMAQTFVCAPGDASAAASSERPFSLRGMPRAPGGDRLEP